MTWLSIPIMIWFFFNQEPKEPPAAPPSTPALQGYISEATQVPPSDGQFKPPEDIRFVNNEIKTLCFKCKSVE